jgi:hypothetical protein
VWTVQKYIERPLLLHGRKFDVRVNALLNDAGDVFVYADGFCRTCSSLYAPQLDRSSGADAQALEMVHVGPPWAPARPCSPVASPPPPPLPRIALPSIIQAPLNAPYPPPSPFSLSPLFPTSARQLTNNCFQEKGAGFGAYEVGNILSFEQLQAHFDATLGAGTLSVRLDLLPRWTELIIDVFCAGGDAVVAGAKDRHFFEAFGFDL